MATLRLLTFALILTAVALLPSAAAAPAAEETVCGDPLQGTIPFANCTAGLIVKAACEIVFGPAACK